VKRAMSLLVGFGLLFALALNANRFPNFALPYLGPAMLGVSLGLVAWSVVLVPLSKWSTAAALASLYALASLATFIWLIGVDPTHIGVTATAAAVSFGLLVSKSRYHRRSRVFKK